MIKGTGVDIIEISRIKSAIERDNKFINKIFTVNEIEYCESKAKKAQHYAARFASKEAFFKALGTGWRNGMSWTDIDINNDSLGKPDIKLSGETLLFFNKLKLSSISLSISHSKKYAVGFVIIE
jgi:holo-[acyl-carrier protein] synthase